MIEQIKMVREFHTVMKAYNLDVPQVNLPSNIIALRKKLIEEETKEVFDAVEKKDLVNLLKEYCDLLYVVFGGIVEHGLDHLIEEAFEMVQKSNMSKLGDDGKPVFREDGKLLKGPNYKAPDLTILFEDKK